MRFFLLILTVATLFLAACSSAPSATPPTEPTPPPTAKPFVFVSDPAMKDTCTSCHKLYYTGPIAP